MLASQPACRAHRENNFYKLKWLSAARFYNALLPFYMIYAHHYGLSFFEIFLTQTIFAVAMIICEVPFGVISDLFGRKKCIVTGGLFLILGSSLMLFWRSFIGFSLAEISWAIAFSAFSGSDTSLLYESVKQSNKAEKYLHQEGVVQSYARYAEAISGITGGLLAMCHMILPAVFTVLINFPALWLGIKLKETRSTQRSKDYRVCLKKKFIKQLLIIKIYFLSNKHISTRYIICYSALISAITITTFWLLQVVMEAHNIAYYQIGIIWLVYHGITGFFSSRTVVIKNILGCQALLFILPSLLLVMALILGLGNSNFLLLFILLGAVTFGLKMPFTYLLLNTQVGSHVRASIISIDSLFTRLFFSIIGLLIGCLLDHYSVQYAFLLLVIPVVIIYFFALKISRLTT